MSNLPINLTDLPTELAEEILSKVPVTSMRSSFAKKHLGRQATLASAREFVVVMMMDFRVYLMRVNLHNEVESCMNRESKLSSLDGSDQIHVSQVFHCEGILLCIAEDNTRILVCNPFSGQSRLIEATHNFYRLDRYLYALGYDKSTSNQSLKVLRFIDYPGIDSFLEFKIYDFSSDSWRVLDVANTDFKIYYYSRGDSLKGDTYWFAEDKYSDTPEEGRDPFFLVCFDFTRECFGPRLPLPFDWFLEDIVSLSSVREEQLAVLFQREDTLQMEIWVTSKIEPNTVSWSSKVFLQVNMKTLLPCCLLFLVTHASFFIDEEKKVAVVFDKDIYSATRNKAYIVEKDGSLKQEDLGESPYALSIPLVCSYVPSLRQLN
ncbi:hypothetical protein EUTSA_v10015430mg [Eutrema salsugineum]|uniref:F-box associated beta-propeller type 1 domain-containing protein n=1 Tax=Eutrema salsugineum TaxID=72664 RepID=V4LJC6_EUTSA|nr:hypothetical protein EUTSA_v10015430mg [Eutrema salsugineum]